MIDQSYRVKNKVFKNRIVLQPMEGCDCEENGAPGELTNRKYIKAAQSGAGTVWFEACAVCPEGRTNPRQMMLTAENADRFRSLTDAMRSVSDERQILILQLTHSGRQSITPMTAYKNPVYEEKRPVPDNSIVSDGYLDALPEKYAKAARLAADAGFDGIDIKSCHGYLLQELLSAYSSPGRYGGPFENRISAYIDCIRAVKDAVTETTLIATRLGVSDMVPFPYGFGTGRDGSPDLSEPDMLISALAAEGVDVLNVTVGNPYYNPHVNRPYRRGAYIPPEPAEKGLERFETVEKHIKKVFPKLTVVGSGLSYHRERIFGKAEELLSDGVCDLVGFGRMWLAYPGFYTDFKNGVFDARKCCAACSRCTELMRGGKPSGCALFDGYYKDLYSEMTKNKNTLPGQGGK